jgi:hypothetical protein
MALWRRLVIGCGAVFGIIVPAWNAFKWLIGWGEHIEFIAHRVYDIHYAIRSCGNIQQKLALIYGL